jgi:hypothetical protein
MPDGAEEKQTHDFRAMRLLFCGKPEPSRYRQQKRLRNSSEPLENIDGNHIISS